MIHERRDVLVISVACILELFWEELKEEDKYRSS